MSNKELRKTLTERFPAWDWFDVRKSYGVPSTADLRSPITTDVDVVGSIAQ